MQRIVLDTTVLATAFRSRHGASNLLLREVARGRVTAAASTALFLEYEAVLKRPEQLAASGLTQPQVDRLLASLAAVLHPAEIHFRWRPQLADPGDELVLEAAINSRAEALVTYNERDFAQAAPRFGLALIRPPAVLKRIGR